VGLFILIMVMFYPKNPMQSKHKPPVGLAT
jgi:hypothetical protein